jgi:hypothetical protein
MVRLMSLLVTSRVLPHYARDLSFPPQFDLADQKNRRIVQNRVELSPEWPFIESAFQSQFSNAD